MNIKVYGKIRCPYCTSYIRKRKWFIVGYYLRENNEKPAYVECSFHGIFGYLVYNKDTTRKKYWMRFWNPKQIINWENNAKL